MPMMKSNGWMRSINHDIGPDTNPKLANIANKAFAKLREIIKKKKSTYKRPKKCEKVVVPRINKDI